LVTAISGGALDADRQMFVPGGVAWNYPFLWATCRLGVVEGTGSAVADSSRATASFTSEPLLPRVIGEAETWKLEADTC